MRIRSDRNNFSLNSFLALLAMSIFTFGGLFVGTRSANASQCTNNVCINVYTDPVTGKIIIDASKVIPGSSKPTPLPSKSSTPTPRPVVKRTFNPTPRPYIRHVPYVYHPPRPKPAKVVTTPTEVAAVNLADQITQLLPSRHIYVQPSDGVVAQVPTYFWSDTGLSFATVTQILGVAVGVNLAPTFSWNFGDGVTVTSQTPGGPLPDRSTGHTYHRAGRYVVTLNVSWLGTWSAGASSYPVVGGAIVQSYSTVVNVNAAPTRFGG